MEDNICRIPVVGHMVKNPDGSYGLNKTASKWEDYRADVIARFLLQRFGKDAIWDENAAS